MYESIFIVVSEKGLQAAKEGLQADGVPSRCGRHIITAEC
jgi:hypothetical protein